MYAIPLKQLLRLVVVIALAATALVATAPARATGTTPCTRTYSASPGTPIPDQQLVSSVIDVPEDGLVVTDVNVTLNIHHTSDSDLTITVQSETDGSSDRAGSFLSDQEGGSGDNFIGTVLDDSAVTPISGGTAPFTGTFTPDTPLSTLNGFAGGRYRLTIFDRTAGNVGTLDSWSVTLTYATCDADNDGLDVPPDACPSIAGATASGCPPDAGSLSLRYRHGKFRGTLSSAVTQCRALRVVTVWKMRPGPDRRVALATTRSDGTYRHARTRHAGRYYATSPRIVLANVAECAAVRSPTIRIR